MQNSRKIIIGSRGSDLALWQAQFVIASLGKLGVVTELKIIKTQGDKIQDLSFDKLEGKGFFTKEIEEALLNKEIDLAVHSHKDLPTVSPTGLTIAAVSEREDPSDILLIRKEFVDAKKRLQIKEGALVGTSSARRKSQLLAFRSDLNIQDLRGNVPTRIEKLRKGDYEAIMLAAAGVERLEIDLSEFHVNYLSPKEFNPAPAQGVLALQTRDDDKDLIEVLQKMNAPHVKETIAIERKILNLFEGGCQMPVGVYCETETNDEDEIKYKVWLSKAEKGDTPLSCFYLETKHPETAAERLVEKARNFKPSKVFISQNKRKEDLFVSLLEKQQYSVHAQSLIEFKIIPFKATPESDWVFFSSKHAVKYFFLQKPQIGKVQFGVVGKSTADELRKFGHKADFVGQSTDTKAIARQFAALAGGKKVLFPQAKGSLMSVQHQMPKKDNVINLTVYETLSSDATTIPTCDILVFTSPSNIDSYLSKQTISPEQKIVVMGDATANHLGRKGIKNVTKTSSFDDLGLARAVFSC